MAYIDQFPGLDGHSCVTAGDYAVLYGGKTGPRTLNPFVFALELSSSDVRRLKTSGALPMPRAYHTAVMWGWKMYVFGGLCAIGVDDIHFNAYNVIANVDALDERTLAQRGINRRRNPATLPRVTQEKREGSSLHVLNLENEPTWSEPFTTGTLPPTRCNHSAAIHRSTMYVFGGYTVHATGRATDEEVKACHLVYALDLNTNVWFVVEAMGGASGPQRWGSASVLCGDIWAFFGGVLTPEGEESNEVTAWHMELAEWRCLPEAAGSPQARTLHSAVRWGSKMIIFGGLAGTGCNVLNDLWSFDLISGRWTEPPQKGDVPLPRSGHAAAVIGECMYILGGLDHSLQRSTRCWSYNLTTGEWRVVPTRFNPLDWTNVRGLAPKRPVVSIGGTSSMTEGPLRLTVVPRVPPTRETQTNISGFGYDDDYQHRQAMLDPRFDVALPGARGFVPPDTMPPVQSHAANLEWMRSDIAKSKSILTNMVEAAAARAEREAQPLHANPEDYHFQPSMASATHADVARGHLQSEIDARIQRLQDMSTTAATSAQSSSQGYWRNELTHLAEENERWRLAVQREHAMLEQSELMHSAPTESQTNLRRLIMSGAPPGRAKESDPSFSSAMYPHSVAPSGITSQSSMSHIHDASNPRYEPLRLVPRGKKYVSPSIVKLNLKLGTSSRS